jgi:hypothetical protein
MQKDTTNFVTVKDDVTLACGYCSRKPDMQEDTLNRRRTHIKSSFQKCGKYQRLRITLAQPRRQSQTMLHFGDYGGNHTMCITRIRDNLFPVLAKLCRHSQGLQVQKRSAEADGKGNLPSKFRNPKQSLPKQDADVILAQADLNPGKSICCSLWQLRISI